MKCSIMLHFIWVFTVCKSTHLGVSQIQRVKEASNEKFDVVLFGFTLES